MIPKLLLLLHLPLRLEDEEPIKTQDAADIGVNISLQHFCCGW